VIHTVVPLLMVDQMNEHSNDYVMQKIDSMWNWQMYFIFRKEDNNERKKFSFSVLP